MNSTYRHLMLSSLLIAGWIAAQAQSSVNPAERIGLTLVDNKSTFVIDAEQNNYENLLRFNQPTGQSKLTAGMLNEGGNPITLHRIDDKGHDIERARVILTTSITRPKILSRGIDFLGSSAPSTNTTLTTSQLPAYWGTNGSGLVWQTSGYGTITSKGGLTFTVPEEWDGGSIRLYVTVGTNVQGGFFSYNLNDEGWRIISGTQVSANSSYYLRTFANVSGGDIISIYGGKKNGSSSYSSTQSPDIAVIRFYYYPTTLVPTIEVSPTISYKDGETWGAESSIGNVMTYTPNDTVNLYGLGIITDTFSESTATNEHPEEYGYRASFGANLVFPAEGSASEDFYASVDFTSATSSSPTSSTFTGWNDWYFSAANIYNPTAGTCCYIQYYGAMLFTMPDTFMGNSVTVSVTTSASDDGIGDVYVNGMPHTFAAGETYSWTIPMAANGTIEFKSNGETYSPDITSIVISSGNRSALNAPQYVLKGNGNHQNRNMIDYPVSLPESKEKRNNEIYLTIE